MCSTTWCVDHEEYSHLEASANAEVLNRDCRPYVEQECFVPGLLLSPQSGILALTQALWDVPLTTVSFLALVIQCLVP